MAGFAGCSSSEDESDPDDEEESLEEESLCCCLLRRWRFLLGFPLVAVAGAIVCELKLSEIKQLERIPTRAFFESRKLRKIDCSRAEVANRVLPGVTRARF